LGSEESIKVNVRVIAACNTDLQAEVQQGRFRADLFYRLNGFQLTLPSLLERREDIPLLAVHFVKKHGYQSVETFSDRAMEILQRHRWPGNVRELENVVRRAAILAQSDGRKIIQHGDLPREITENESPEKLRAAFLSLDAQILEMLRALKFSRSAISETAKALGNRDRGTITGYFRGLCFEHLVNADYEIDAAARSLAGTNDAGTIERVKAKINEYLKSLQFPDGGTPASAYKGLPKKYHGYLMQITEHLRDSLK
jgi:transcriptional regulator with GAF, ATPase, and Fis domain